MRFVRELGAWGWEVGAEGVGGLRASAMARKIASIRMLSLGCLSATIITGQTTANVLLIVLVVIIAILAVVSVIVSAQLMLRCGEEREDGQALLQM